MRYKLLQVAILCNTVFSSAALAAPPLTVDLDKNFTHLVEGDVHERYQYISWDVIEYAKWNQSYILNVKDGASFTVEGNTKIHQYAPHSDEGDVGSYAVHTSGGKIYLLGNVDIVSRHQEQAGSINSPFAEQG